jgi:hypothetical protein
VHKSFKIHIITIVLTSLVFFSAFGVQSVSAGTNFHSKDTLIGMFKALCDSHPDQASYVIVGKSYEGRDIYLFRFGNPNGGCVMWDGCLHGWEDMSSEVEYHIANWLLNSGTAEASRILLNNYVLFMPIVNVDSTERENRDFSRDKFGVDLNRNFVSGFSYIAPVNTGYPNSFHGAFGGSEPEVKAVRSVLSVYRPEVYVNTHYGGAPVLQAAGLNDTLSSLIMGRIVQLSGQAGFSCPWPMTKGVIGAGCAPADGNAFGANSWHWELASASSPIATGKDSGACYMHTAHSLADIENYFFPRALPVFRAMCESVEVSNSLPNPSSSPTPTVTPTQTPAPTQSPISGAVWFKTGFEASLMNDWYYYNSNGAVPATDSSIKRSGISSVKFSTSATLSEASSVIRKQLTSSVSSSICASGYFFVSAPTLTNLQANDRFYLIRLLSSGSLVAAVGVRCEGVDSLRWCLWRFSSSGCGQVYGSVVSAVPAWTNVQVSLSGVDGSCQVWVNGNLEVSVAGLSGLPNLTTVEFGISKSGAVGVSYDPTSKYVCTVNMDDLTITQ